ncbi:MAG: hypothetical protein WCI11_11105 [Candidatus Methylumidiphilus sp.]
MGTSTSFGSRRYTQVWRNPSFRHGLPESSHKDVNLWVGASPESSTCASGKLPSMALDSGILSRNDGVFLLGGTCV